MVSTFDPMDSGDEDFYYVSYDDLLDAGDKVETINSIAVDTTAGGLGVVILSSQILPDPSSQVPGRVVEFKLGVTDAFHNNAAFNGDGLVCTVTVNITSAKDRKLEREVEIPIKQI